MYKHIENGMGKVGLHDCRTNHMSYADEIFSVDFSEGFYILNESEPYRCGKAKMQCHIVDGYMDGISVFIYKKNFFGIFCVLMSAIIAILVHALLPSPGASLSVESFDGILVQKFGFPIVASIYFVILYLHIFIVICMVGAKSTIPKRQMGIRFGLSFGCMYLVGMQEVVVSASPCDTYGIDFERAVSKNVSKRWTGYTGYNNWLYGNKIFFEE